MCLQHDLRLAGLDPDRVARIADRSMADNVAALETGAVDVVQVFEPFASLLESKGAGHVWVRRRASRADLLHDFLRAASHAPRPARRASANGARHRPHGTVGWRASARSRSPVRLRPIFPTCRAPSSKGPARATRGSEIWGRSPVLPREGYERLHASLVSGRLRRARHAVRDSRRPLAERVVAERVSPLG